MASSTRAARSTSSSVAYGLALFAGIMMVVVGIFQALAGIAALANDSFFVVARNYTFNIDVTAWGWIHIVFGVVVGLVGVGVIMGNLFARISAIIVVSFVMIDNFLFIPYYPLWAILLLAIDALIMWALVTAPMD